MTYRKDLDAIKGLAIISIVLYHFGLLKSGYLGVDVFFVINGFFIIPSLWQQIQKQNFHYGNFILKRMMRLMPLTVIATAVCLLIGFFGMLPDNYENLTESIIASNLYSENILSNITTKNYWDIVNDYKPLMHMWFVGILVEFYIIFPLIMMIWYHCIKKFEKHINLYTNIFFGILIIISLGLYLVSSIPEHDKFYLLQYRFYELVLGGLIGINISQIRDKVKITSPIAIISCLCLLFLVVWSSIFKFDISTINSSTVIIGGSVPDDWAILPKPILLLLTVLITCIILLFDNIENKFVNNFLYNKIFVWLGKISFSIFVWHQIILAFYRYFYSNKITVIFLLIYFIVVLAISILSYYFIEQKVKISWKTFTVFASISLVICVISGIIYLRAGVVRDVPELNIKMESAHRGMHAEYSDKIYSYYKEFNKNSSNKYNVLIVGNSFARDFANVLLESNYKDSINLTYKFDWGGGEDLLDLIKQSDYIFSFSSKSKVPKFVWQNKSNDCEIWGIGTKSYGECMGIVYSHRKDEDYKDYSVKIDDRYVELNDEWKNEWEDHYIDFIGIAEEDRGVVRVFTPDGKFISQDCRHLTKAGAQWYASVIDFNNIFNSI